MKPSTPSIGIFPRGIDGVMMTSHELPLQPVFLVLKGSSDEHWLGSFESGVPVLGYELDVPRTDVNNMSLPYLLTRSDLMEKMHSAGIGYLLCDHGTVGQALLSRLNSAGIQVLPPFTRSQRRFEDKIWFDAFLERNNIPKPLSAVLDYPRLGTTPSWEGKIVVQAPHSSDSEGTFFLEGTGNIEHIFTSGGTRKSYLMRKFVDGTSYGITLFISSSTVALSAVRTQCFEEVPSEKRKLFLGVQWLNFHDLYPELVPEINTVFMRLATVMRLSGYRGYANIDFIVDGKGKVHVIECNARHSAATSQLIHFPELISGISTDRIMIEETSAHAQADEYTAYPLPVSDLLCCSMDIRMSRAGRISRVFRNGVYELTEDFEYVSPDIRELHKGNICYYSDVRPGERYDRYDQVGTVVSGLPLFMPDGTINETGRRVISHFLHHDETHTGDRRHT